MTKKQINERIDQLVRAFKLFLNNEIEFKTNDYQYNIDFINKVEGDFGNCKGEIRKLKRLRDDDLELIASLSLQLGELKKALLYQRENIMLLMEHFKLYFDLENNEKVVKKESRK